MGRYITKIIKWFQSLAYGLVYGFKTVDDIAFKTTNLSDNNTITIQDVIRNRRLSQSLIKGEVTQEVEELRYRDYKVSREASRYSYNGDGTATRKKDDITRHIKFIQPNKLNVSGVLDGESRFNGDKADNYTLEILYDDFPRFKLETYCTYFEVDTNELSIKLHFENKPDKYNFKTKSFINELNKLVNNNQLLLKHEFLTNVKQISFTTYKADGEDDTVRYMLYHLKCVSIKNTKNEFILKFIFDYYVREDLIDKYFSPTMEAKYQNKEAKVSMTEAYSINENETFYCAQCGEIVNPIDAKITKETYGYPLCQKCLQKILDINKEANIF